MNEPIAAAVVPSLLLGIFAWRYRRRSRSLALRLAAVERREAAMLEAARVLTAASGESSDAVLRALDAVVRLIQPSVDSVLVYRPEGEDLVCAFTAGERAEHYAATRVRADDPAALPSSAAMKRCRVGLDRSTRAIVPTDRSALAVPMEDADGLRAVAYLSSRHDAAFDREDSLVRAVSHAAAPYALALERESDRANATYDALTGLYAPRAFREALKDDVARANLSGRATISLWFVDTDHFKRVNDTFGHAAGDRVLQQMAGLLRQHMVAGVDLAARNGGDEFCAVLRGEQKSAALERAQRFCEAVRAYDFGVDIALGASVGVASYPYDALEASRLLEIADAAMYFSKRAGRGRVSFAAGAGFEVYR